MFSKIRESQKETKKSIVFLFYQYPQKIQYMCIDFYGWLLWYKFHYVSQWKIKFGCNVKPGILTQVEIKLKIVFFCDRLTMAYGHHHWNLKSCVEILDC